MVVPAPRDPDITREILTRWLGDPARLPGARITDLRTPEFTGFSSEILMLDVEHHGGTEALAVRVAPLHYQVFPERYGLEPDWKHGMYQGPDLVVQGIGYDLSRPQDAARMWGMVDAVGRFDYDGHTGYGLYEYWALGDHPSFR